MYEIIVLYQCGMSFTNRKHLKFERLYIVLIIVMVQNHLKDSISQFMSSDYE